MAYSTNLSEPHTFEVLQAAYDYADYDRAPCIKRWWDDLTYDLGHDNTLRSKIFWTFLTVILAHLSYIIMRSLGWYQ